MFTQFTLPPPQTLSTYSPGPVGMRSGSPTQSHLCLITELDGHLTHYDPAVRDQFPWQYGGPGADRHVTGLHIADAVRPRLVRRQVNDDNKKGKW